MKPATVLSFWVVFLSVLASVAWGQTPSTTAPSASISGRVLDELSNPYQARIQAFQFVVRDGHTDLYPKCLADTAVDGTYTCRSLEPGAYVVVVEPAPLSTIQPPMIRPTLTWKYPRSIFYPATTDFESAEPLHLAAGKTAFCDFRLTEATPGVMVSAPLGDVPRTADIRVMAQLGHLQIDSGIPGRKNLKANIIYARDVPKGHFLLKALWTDAGGMHQYTREFVSGNQELTLRPLEPTELVTVQAQTVVPPDGKVTMLTLYRRDDSQQKVVGTFKDGAFVFPPVPTGEYYVGLPINTDLYLTDVTVGSRHFSYNVLNLAGGQASQSIVLEFKRPGGEIKGVLSNWKESAPNVQMVLLREDTGQVFTRPADDHGTFHFIGVPPASYRLYAWPLEEHPEYRSPSFQKKHARDGVGITVDASSVYQAGSVKVEHLPSLASN